MKALHFKIESAWFVLFATLLISRRGVSIVWSESLILCDGVKNYAYDAEVVAAVVPESNFIGKHALTQNIQTEAYGLAFVHEAYNSNILKLSWNILMVSFR